MSIIDIPTLTGFLTDHGPALDLAVTAPARDRAKAATATCHRAGHHITATP